MTAILGDAGVRVLDGDGVEIRGVGFAGVKGFAGGFGERALQSWGEPILKQFVREAVEEALKLEQALARLRTPHRIAVLHYSPIRATVETEPAEILPFLGSSRLEDPINRYSATLVVHGHAHHGNRRGAHGHRRAGLQRLDAGAGARRSRTSRRSACSRSRSVSEAAAAEPR